MNVHKQKAKAVKMDEGCYQRARKRGQQTFTLVSQDRTAPWTVCQCIAANIETAPEKKLIDALKDALAMRDQKDRKWAD
jgi:hypothetical protein